MCPTSGTYCSRNLLLWLINIYDSWQGQVPGASGSRCLSTQVRAGAVPPPLPHPSWPADRKQVSPSLLLVQESSLLSWPQTAYSSETNHSNNKNHSIKKFSSVISALKCLLFLQPAWIGEKAERRILNGTYWLAWLTKRRHFYQLNHNLFNTEKVTPFEKELWHP